MLLQHIPLEFFVLCAGVFGAAAGSFFHVCIYRIPNDISVVTPSSHCPHCEHEIAWYDNLPLISYLFLGGRCRVCKTKIPIRYFVYEAISAGLFMGVVAVYSVTYTALIYIIFASVLLVASGIDWDHFFIPDFLSKPMIYLSIVAAAAAQYTGKLDGVLVETVYEALLGIAVGGGLIWAIRAVGSWFFQQDAMGFGDVKLMAYIGGFLGWQEALLCIFVASLIGSIVGLSLKYMGKVEQYGHIPFGPYLSLGAYVCLMIGPSILHWYLEPFSSTFP